MLVAQKFGGAMPQEQDWANGDAFVADLEHHPGTKSTPGKNVPCIPTHSRLWSWRKERLMTGLETLAAQGIDVLPVLSGDRGVSPLGHILASLAVREQKQLAGNMMHIPTFAKWMMYVMGNTIRTTDAYRLSSPMPPAGDESVAAIQDSE